MGRATFRKTPISLSTKDKSRCTSTTSNVTLRMKSQHEGALTPQLHHPEKATGSNRTRQVGCHPVNNSRGKQSSIPQRKTRPDSPVPTLQRPCDRSQKFPGFSPGGSREFKEGTVSARFSKQFLNEILIRDIKSNRIRIVQ